MKVYVAIAEYIDAKDFSILGTFLSAEQAGRAIKEDKATSLSRSNELYYEIVETQLDLFA